MKVLKHDSKTMKVIEEIEQFMEDRGVSVNTYSHLYLEINGQQFKIGIDSCEFPRQFEDNFILCE